MGNTTVKFYTGVGTVTGANFSLEMADGTKILIDCGLVQGAKVTEEVNREVFPYDLSTITALVVTHAHLDHVGRIPKLVRDGFTGPIYSTPQTKELAELVLNDAIGILTSESKRDGQEPLYSQADVDAAISLWKTVDYHEEFRLSDDMSMILKDAGHILGSSMVEITIGTNHTRLPTASVEKGSDPHIQSGAGVQMKVLFTGDLGNSPAPLLRDTEEIGDADYLIMESVYGDRNHANKDGRTDRLKQIIDETIARGGTLVIPAFSIDRTQILLYELNNMVERGEIKSVPVFVDSPLATKATGVYASNTELFNDHVREQIKRGDDVFRFKHLEYAVSSNESQDIDKINSAKIILAGSGMSVGGRVIGHEAHYLPDEKNTILLVGYQTVGSLGRQLADGAKKVRIYDKEVKVKAHVETLYDFSAHKDSDHLVEFVSTGTDRLKKVFVVMGEPGSSMHLAQRINDELGVDAIVPEREQDYIL